MTTLAAEVSYDIHVHVLFVFNYTFQCFSVHPSDDIIYIITILLHVHTHTAQFLLRFYCFAINSTSNGRLVAHKLQYDNNNNDTQ